MNWAIVINKKNLCMSSLFRKSLENIPEEKKLLVEKLFDITDQILDILERKNMTQKELAQRLQKSESEISKWMKGTHNFTEETIAKIELALGEPITITMKQAEEKYNGLMRKMEEKDRQFHNLEKFLRQKGIEPGEYSYAMSA